jgi:hypothetical protein
MDYLNLDKLIHTGLYIYIYIYIYMKNKVGGLTTLEVGGGRTTPRRLGGQPSSNLGVV